MTVAYADTGPVEQYYRYHIEQPQTPIVLHDYVDPNEPSGQTLLAKNFNEAYWSRMVKMPCYFPSESFRHFLISFELNDEKEQNIEDHNPCSIASPEDMIASIRSALSLQIKELAEIIHVKRQAIYSWINDESVPSNTNSLRLNQIYQLAKSWNNLSSLSVGKMIRQQWEDNQSLIDLLKEDMVNEGEVIRRFKEIAKDLSQQNDQDGHGFRHMIKKHGLAEERVNGDRDLFDALTGKGFSPE